MLQIVAIDLLLGGDNAVVIAMACRKLPPQKRTKAIIIGTVGAILARVLLLAIALYLLSLPWLKIVGALLLLWIGIKLVRNEEEESEVSSSGSLWRTAITITVADVIMSLDNVLAVAAAGKGTLRWSPSAWRSAFRLLSPAASWCWSCSPAFPRWCCWAGCSSAGLPGQCWSATLPFASCFPAPARAPRAGWRRRRAAGAIHRMAPPPTAAGEGLILSTAPSTPTASSFRHFSSPSGRICPTLYTDACSGNM